MWNGRSSFDALMNGAPGVLMVAWSERISRALFPSLLLIAVSTLVSRPAFAECLDVDIHTFAELAGVVFSGTVTRMESRSVSKKLTGQAMRGEAITFAVDRVWKGSPSKQFVVYNIRYSIESIAFMANTKYLVFAYRHSKEERTALGLAASGPPTFGIGLCGQGTRFYERAKDDIPKLGVGRTPPPN